MEVVLGRFYIFGLVTLFCSLTLSSIAVAEGKQPVNNQGKSPVHSSPRYSLNPNTIKVDKLDESFGPALPVSPAIASLTPSFLTVNSQGEVYLRTLPMLQPHHGAVVGKNQRGDFVVYSVDPQLHDLAKKLLKNANAAHVAIVAMDPHTGKILALAEKSTSLRHSLLHSKFPAASLFKVVTSSAALETSSISPNTMVYFRGGNYQLDRGNYSVNPRLDKRSMSLTEALGKSCNPVFGRVALKYLTPRTLKRYASAFGFDTDLKFDIPLIESHAEIPSDAYGLSRTAAGFGNVTLSPIHAAAMMSAIANEGVMPRPYVVNNVISKNSTTIYTPKTQYLKRVIKPATARTVLNMMESTTTKGTARKDFYYRGKPLLPRIRVAAKTGTLRGTNPVGLNRWFIAAAPIESPKIALAVLAINPVNGQARPAYIGRKLIEDYVNRK